MTKRLATLVMLLTAVNGCATIVSGTSEVVTFNSNPNGVEIYMEGNKLGVTPLSVKLPRGQGKTVLAKKEGYDDQITSLQTHLNPWFWGNILIGGLLGSTTDYVSDAAFEYAPNSYYITLNPKKASQAERERLAKTMRQRNFILATYHNIQSDLAGESGDYLTSLHAILEIGEPSERSVRELRALGALHPSIPGFAEAVVDHFSSQ